MRMGAEAIWMYPHIRPKEDMASEGEAGQGGAGFLEKKKACTTSQYPGWVFIFLESLQTRSSGSGSGCRVQTAPVACGAPESQSQGTCSRGCSPPLPWLPALTGPTADREGHGQGSHQPVQENAWELGGPGWGQRCLGSCTLGKGVGTVGNQVGRHARSQEGGSVEMKESSSDIQSP